MSVQTHPRIMWHIDGKLFKAMLLINSDCKDEITEEIENKLADERDAGKSAMRIGLGWEDSSLDDYVCSQGQALGCFKGHVLGGEVVAIQTQIPDFGVAHWTHHLAETWDIKFWGNMGKQPWG